MTTFFDPRTTLSSMGGLAVILTYLSEADLKVCRPVSQGWKKAVEKTPLLIQPHRFQAKIQHRNGSVYLRMELITNENYLNWQIFQKATEHLVPQVEYIAICARRRDPYSSEIKNDFTPEEYALLQKKIADLPVSKQDKLLSTLWGISHGVVEFKPEIMEYPKYVVYATNDPYFNIPQGNENLNYKQYKDLYKPILIAFVSKHPFKKSFENRGIFRPFHHVLENQYEGLSMVLHGFTGIVAKKFFPTLDTMTVKPIPSMQTIIKQNLKPGEGFFIRKREKFLPIVIPKGGFTEEWTEDDAICKSRNEDRDILDYVVNERPRDECPTNFIQNSALIRIYSQS